MSEKITVTYSFPPPPKGWEFDHVRPVKDESEMYFNGIKWIRWTISGVRSSGTYPVAVRSKWRPATEADIGREDARFSDCGCKWSNGKLVHLINGGVPFPYIAILEMMPTEPSSFSRCEVPVEDGK